MIHASYLVQYGRSACVGRFRPSSATACERGDRVVVRGLRGLEVGVVLCEPADRFARLVEDDGELVRPATADDEAATGRHDSLAASLLDAGRDRADTLGLSLELVDAEIALDGQSAVVHALPWGPCDATALLDELSARFGLAVRLLDLSRTPTVADEPEPKASGCGTGGCGSEGGGCSSCGTGGGCSTGSCSRGVVKKADELTSYFADLRRRMEASADRRTPLA